MYKTCPKHVQTILRTLHIHRRPTTHPPPQSLDVQILDPSQVSTVPHPKSVDQDSRPPDSRPPDSRPPDFRPQTSEYGFRSEIRISGFYTRRV